MPKKTTKKKKRKVNTLRTRRLSTVEVEEVDWIWLHRVLAGKLNIIHGPPGVGKTWLALYVAACITTGRDFCDGTPCPQGEVLFISDEDGAADTVRPRVDLMGGASARVHVPEDDELFVVDEKGEPHYLDLARNTEQLFNWLEDYPQVRMIVLDPLSAFMGDTNCNSNSEVRKVLTPLRHLAAEHDVALLAIDHLSKGGGKQSTRGNGSIAFTAGPRSSFQVVADPQNDNPDRDPNKPDRSLYLHNKCNLSPIKAPGLAFSLDEQRGIVWHAGKVATTLNDIQAHEEKGPRTSKVKVWLTKLLASEPKLRDEIAEEACKLGFSMATVKNYKADLGIESKKQLGKGGSWWWGCPAVFEGLITKKDKRFVKRPVKKTTRKRPTKKGARR